MGKYRLELGIFSLLCECLSRIAKTKTRKCKIPAPLFVCLCGTHKVPSEETQTVFLVKQHALLLILVMSLLALPHSYISLRHGEKSDTHTWPALPLWLHVYHQRVVLLSSEPAPVYWRSADVRQNEEGEDVKPFGATNLFCFSPFSFWVVGFCFVLVMFPCS